MPTFGLPMQPNMEPYDDFDDENDQDLDAPNGIIPNAITSIFRCGSALSSHVRDAIHNVHPIHGAISAVLLLTGIQIGVHFESSKHAQTTDVFTTAQQAKDSVQAKNEYTPAPSTSPQLPYTPRKVVIGRLINDH